MDHIIKPYLEEARADCPNPSQKALLIVDLYRGQLEQAIVDYIKQQNIVLHVIPANCTDALQPMDQLVNSKLKQSLSPRILPGMPTKFYKRFRVELLPRTGKWTPDF